MRLFVLALVISLCWSHWVAAAPKPEGGEAEVDSSEEEMSSGNDEHDRKMLVGELIKLESKLDADIEKNDHYDIRYALVNLESKILPRVARLSKKIDAALTNPDQRAGELKLQKTIIEDITRILYKAGARSCLQPDETYLVAEDICVPYGNNTGVNKCTGKDQILYDAKNNVGVCDCVEDERQLIYYKGECHIQNVQGPCNNGSWLIMKAGKPVCEPIPVNCTADGQHVHWSPDPVKVKAECHQLNQRGPCSVGQIVSRDQKGIKCIFPPEPKGESGSKAKVAEKSLWDRPTCALGSYRHQNGICAV